MDTTNLKEHEEVHRRYTQHLAEAMGRTKEIVAAKLLWEIIGEAPKDYIKEVDFNE